MKFALSAKLRIIFETVTLSAKIVGGVSNIMVHMLNELIEFSTSQSNMLKNINA